MVLLTLFLVPIYIKLNHLGRILFSIFSSMLPFCPSTQPQKKKEGKKGIVIFIIALCPSLSICI